MEVESALFGTGWELMSVTAIDNLPEVTITLHFREGSTLDGLSACNSYNASYTVASNNMEISPIISTQKECAEPEGVMEQEQLYAANLFSAEFNLIENGVLTLKNPDGETAVTFVPVE